MAVETQALGRLTSGLEAKAVEVAVAGAALLVATVTEVAGLADALTSLAGAMIAALLGGLDTNAGALVAGSAIETSLADAAAVGARAVEALAAGYTGEREKDGIGVRMMFVKVVWGREGVKEEETYSKDQPRRTPARSSTLQERTDTSPSLGREKEKGRGEQEEGGADIGAADSGVPEGLRGPEAVRKRMRDHRKG